MTSAKIDNKKTLVPIHVNASKKEVEEKNGLVQIHPKSNLKDVIQPHKHRPHIKIFETNHNLKGPQSPPVEDKDKGHADPKGSHFNAMNPLAGRRHTNIQYDHHLHMGKHSAEIMELNASFRAFKTKSKSHQLQSKKHSVPVHKGTKDGLFLVNQDPKLSFDKSTTESTDLTGNEEPAKGRRVGKIGFHHEDEVKLYVPHPASYKLSIQKSPHGLEIFTHSEQIWLESTTDADDNSSRHTYDVFDESFVKIITVEPKYGDHDSDEESPEISINQDPSEFICHTSVGKEICVMTYTLTKKKSCCPWHKKNIPFVKLELSVKDKKMGTVEQKESSIIVKNVEMMEMMEMKQVPEYFYKCTKCQKKPFQCHLTLKDEMNAIFGTVGRNSSAPKEIFHGQPSDFYFTKNLQVPHSHETDTLYKLYALAILIGLKTIYTTLETKP